MAEDVLAYTEEQDALRENVRGFLDDHASVQHLRAFIEAEALFDRAVWARMATELELQSLGIPAEFGGAGFGLQEMAIVMEELGSSLYSGPYFSSCVMAAEALVQSGDGAAQEKYLPSIADGSTIASVAFVEDPGSWEPEAAAATASEDGGGWRISGHKSYVLGGDAADLLLVTAQAKQGLSLFALPVAAPGVTRSATPGIDLSRRLARFAFDQAPAMLVGVAGEAAPVMARMLDRSRVALAAEQLGGARRCLDMAVAYAKVRHQFGQPIGSFQAIKHKCVDMLVKVEAAQTAVMAASIPPLSDRELALAASVAQSHCSDAYFWCASETIQIHGGIGFTWEHDAHLYFRRAKASELLLGDGAYHRARLARLLADTQSETRN